MESKLLPEFLFAYTDLLCSARRGSATPSRLATEGLTAPASLRVNFNRKLALFLFLEDPSPRLCKAPLWSSLKGRELAGRWVW